MGAIPSKEEAISHARQHYGDYKFNGTAGLVSLLTAMSSKKIGLCHTDVYEDYSVCRTRINNLVQSYFDKAIPSLYINCLWYQNQGQKLMGIKEDYYLYAYLMFGNKEDITLDDIARAVRMCLPVESDPKQSQVKNGKAYTGTQIHFESAAKTDVFFPTTTMGTTGVRYSYCSTRGIMDYDAQVAVQKRDYDLVGKFSRFVEYNFINFNDRCMIPFDINHNLAGRVTTSLIPGIELGLSLDSQEMKDIMSLYRKFFTEQCPEWTQATEDIKKPDPIRLIGEPEPKQSIIVVKEKMAKKRPAKEKEKWKPISSGPAFNFDEANEAMKKGSGKRETTQATEMESMMTIVKERRRRADEEDEEAELLAEDDGDREEQMEFATVISFQKAPKMGEGTVILKESEISANITSEAPDEGENIANMTRVVKYPRVRGENDLKSTIQECSKGGNNVDSEKDSFAGSTYKKLEASTSNYGSVEEMLAADDISFHQKAIVVNALLDGMSITMGAQSTIELEDTIFGKIKYFPNIVGGFRVGNALYRSPLNRQDEEQLYFWFRRMLMTGERYDNPFGVASRNNLMSLDANSFIANDEILEEAVRIIATVKTMLPAGVKAQPITHALLARMMACISANMNGADLNMLSVDERQVYFRDCSNDIVSAEGTARKTTKNLELVNKTDQSKTTYREKIAELVQDSVPNRLEIKNSRDETEIVYVRRSVGRFWVLCVDAELKKYYESTGNGFFSKSKEQASTNEARKSAAANIVRGGRVLSKADALTVLNDPRSYGLGDIIKSTRIAQGFADEDSQRAFMRVYMNGLKPWCDSLRGNIFDLLIDKEKSDLEKELTINSMNPTLGNNKTPDLLPHELNCAPVRVFPGYTTASIAAMTRVISVACTFSRANDWETAMRWALFNSPKGLAIGALIKQVQSQLRMRKKIAGAVLVDNPITEEELKDAMHKLGQDGILSFKDSPMNAEPFDLVYERGPVDKAPFFVSQFDAVVPFFSSSLNQTVLEDMTLPQALAAGLLPKFNNEVVNADGTVTFEEETQMRYEAKSKTEEHFNSLKANSSEYKRMPGNWQPDFITAGQLDATEGADKTIYHDDSITMYVDKANSARKETVTACHGASVRVVTSGENIGVKRMIGMTPICDGGDHYSKLFGSEMTAGVLAIERNFNSGQGMNPSSLDLVKSSEDVRYYFPEHDESTIAAAKKLKTMMDSIQKMTALGKVVSVNSAFVADIFRCGREGLIIPDFFFYPSQNGGMVMGPSANKAKISHVQLEKMLKESIAKKIGTTQSSIADIISQKNNRLKKRVAIMDGVFNKAA